MSHRICLIGKKFGRLTVLKYNHTNKHGQAVWEAICDCGKTNLSSSCNLKSGRGSSCGCFKKEKTSNPFGESFLKNFFTHYKCDARAKNRVFELSFEYFRKLATSNCSYCGGEPIFYANKKNYNGNVPVNGIDRINSSIGYTEMNSVACCKRCNGMKSNLKKEDFISHISKIYEFNKIIEEDEAIGTLSCL